jgi:hypothetical protein
MYDERVKRLREAPNDWPDADLHYDAADAIEELKKISLDLLARYEEKATSVIWETSGHINESLDYLHEEIASYIAKINGAEEPLKEET